VDRTGPAAKSGLRAGDVVLAVNGQPVETSRGLIRAVAATAPGGNVSLSVRRQGRDLEVPVMVGRRPANDQG
jgi:serine protease Do